MNRMAERFQLAHGRYTSDNGQGSKSNVTFQSCSDLGIRRVNSSDFNLPTAVRERALFWAVFIAIFYTSTMAAFYLLRPRFAMLRKRSYFLLVVQTLGQFFNLCKFLIHQTLPSSTILNK